MKYSLYLLSILVLFIFQACGGSKDLPKTHEGDIPDWYINTPNDPNFVFTTSTASSQDMQMAVDKAATGARAEIARVLEVKINDLQKKFAEETGANDNSTFLSQMTQATKTIVSTSLTGSSIKEKKVYKDGNLWRAYVLAQYPVGAANQALVEQIKKNNELYTRFRASQSFEELDKEVEKLNK